MRGNIMLNILKQSSSSIINTNVKVIPIGLRPITRCLGIVKRDVNTNMMSCNIADTST